MFRVRSVAVRFLNLFRRRRIEADLREQMDAHRAGLEQQLVGRGTGTDEARKAARAILGNDMRIREAARNEHFFVWVETVVADFRLALRRLRARPVMTVLSLAALAWGVGAATATWILVSGVVLDPLPAVDTEALVFVDRPVTQELGFRILTETRSHAEFLRLKDAGVFTQATAFYSEAPPLTVTIDGVSIDARTYFVSGTFFDTLGVRPVIGRSFTPGDDRFGAMPVVIVSHQFWRNALGSDPSVLGEEIFVGDRAVTIVGVAPRGFRGLDLTTSVDLYVPLRGVTELVPLESPPGWFAETFQENGPSWLHVIGRLRPGTEPDQAESFLDGLELFSRVGEELGLPQRWRLLDLRSVALPFSSREGMKPFSTLLGLTVGMLLLIGCLAVGTLLLVCTESRRDEFAMCLALGSSRRRLVVGVVIEGAILAALGGLVSLPVAQWLLLSVRRFELPGGLPIGALGLSMDWGAFITTLVASMAAVVFIGGIGGSFGFTVRNDALVSKPAGARTFKRRTMRSVLVVSQTAMALVLLAGTGLFARSVLAAFTLNPGYDTDRIVSARITLPNAYTRARADAFYEAVKERLGAHPAVESATASALLLVQGLDTESFLDDRGVRLPSTATWVEIDSEYFGTLGVLPIAGRSFLGEEPNVAGVAVVSEGLARVLDDGGGVLGRRLRRNDRAEAREVVGVVPEIIMNVTELNPLTVYVPSGSGDQFNRTVTVRAAGNSGPAARALRDTIAVFDDPVEISAVQTIDERLIGQLRTQQFGATMMGGLGGVAVLLTAMAIYVLAESTANGRRRELGIRSALGARRWQLGRIVFSETMRLVGLGVAVGLGVSWMGAGMIEAFLYRIEPFDLPTFSVTAVALLVLAVIASLRPGLAAMRVDPARTLREE